MIASSLRGEGIVRPCVAPPSGKASVACAPTSAPRGVASPDSDLAVLVSRQLRRFVRLRSEKAECVFEPLRLNCEGIIPLGDTALGTTRRWSEFNRLPARAANP